MIHPTAVIDPAAELDSSVQVGPYAVIEAGVKLGRGCRVGPHVHLMGPLQAGADNRFHTGAVLGDAPQDLKYQGAPTRLLIGDRNVFREHATVHRSNKLEEDTTIGSDNFLMAGCHVGHNSHVGNFVIIANGAQVAGHVEIGDRAFISGNCLIHQFCRVGTLALMQGGAAISQDLPPFTIAQRENEICGLNVIGLRRAGISGEDRLELKQLYHRLFRSGSSVKAALSQALPEIKGSPARILCEFVSSAKRGICSDVSRVPREPEAAAGE